MARNRLAGALSPYLQGLGHSPVDWYPWGEEALELARREDKPIFLSVGYSTCYWCQVMAREEFYDEAVADFLNRHFVAIHLDREERPDVDELYMAATQLLTHGGGWPNTVFLLPDLRPWFCGTYFPPEDRGDQPGFATVLESMVHAWHHRRAEVEEQAAELDDVLRRYLEERGGPGEVPGEVPPASRVEEALESLLAVHDPEHGGFGTGAKFPMPANLFFLAELAPESAAAARVLDHTLDHMARGGLRDPLGGGFHRHATDRAWKVPCFEKLLAENGLLLELYARRYEHTGDRDTERVVRQLAAFLDRDLSLEGGGFAAALGPPDDGPEGAEHVWAMDELVAVLGEEDAGFLAPILGYDRPPFFEGSYYVLHLPSPLGEQAARRRMGPEELAAQVAHLLEKLRVARRRRRPPKVDDKVQADWNGMAIAGLATAGRVLGDEALIERARRAADFVIEHLRPNGQLRHVWRGGTAKWGAFLADYVHLARGALALDTATDEPRWRSLAVELTAEQSERLADPRGGFSTAAPSPELRWRSREIVDGGLPAANAVAIWNLLELGERDRAEAALAAFGGAAEQGEGTRSLCVAVRRFHARRP